MGGIRHSKKSVDIQSSPKKNGTEATEVKVKEIKDEVAPVKATEETKTTGETIEEVAEKDTTTAKEATTPNGDASTEHTQVEEKNEANKEETKEPEKKEEEKKEEEKKEKKVKKKKSFRSFSFLRREKKVAKQDKNGDVAKEEAKAET